jgi:hypothetical protein
MQVGMSLIGRGKANLLLERLGRQTSKTGGKSCRATQLKKSTGMTFNESGNDPVLA